MEKTMDEKYKEAVSGLSRLEKALNPKKKLPAAIQTISGVSKNRPYEKLPTPKDDVEVESGIFDKMVNELPPELEVKKSTKRKNHTTNKTKIWKKRKVNAKAARQARKKQRTKKK